MERLLVALDGSARAKHVLAVAVDLAQRTGAKLHLLRAVALPPELPAALWATAPTDATESLLLAGRRDLEDLEALVPEALRGGVSCQVGVPWDAICTAAREWDVDLVVLGSHGHGLLDRIVGTTAAKVVNHVDRSVLVVKERSRREG